MYILPPYLSVLWCCCCHGQVHSWGVEGNTVCLSSCKNYWLIALCLSLQVWET